MDLLAFILAISAPDVTDEQVQTALNAYIAEHPEAVTTVTDGSITKAKLDSNLQATVDDVGVLKSAVEILEPAAVSSDVGKVLIAKTVEDGKVTEYELGSASGNGLTQAIKAALLQIASKVAYIDDDGQDYYDDLYDALYPPASLVSISATYTQSGTVYTTDSLDSLKSDLVVTATYNDSSTETVPSANYTLSGTLEEGTSTITVSYGGKTDTFNVTVSVYDTAPEIQTSGVCWSKTPPDTVNADGFGITVWYDYEFTQAALESCAYWDPTNGYMTTNGWCGIKYYISDVKTIAAGKAWPASANYKNVAGKNHVYTDYVSITKNAESVFAFSRQSTAFVDANGVSFSLPILDIDDCYAYWIKPANNSILPSGVSVGDIIFAGENTPYYGMHNISEASA